MSAQTFFSKQDPTEKLSRLSLLGSSKGEVIVWKKGTREKKTIKAMQFDKEGMSIVLDSKEVLFQPNETILCSFELSGMNFFSEVIFQVSISGYTVLNFNGILFKSERRNSYRLMTYPLYEVWASFDLGESYEGGKVVDLKTRTNQTGLFRSFLKLVEGKDVEIDVTRQLNIRVQDLSTTGMALHVSEVESQFFQKDVTYQNVKIRFIDELIVIPEARIMYLVDYISNDKNIKRYKVGINFPNLPIKIDDVIGKKINKLLRENDFNKDFENFVK